MRKNCWIINKLTNQVFYGSLNTEIECSDSYPYLEIPTELIGKNLKWCSETNKVVEDFETEFKKELDYQHKSWGEFCEDIAIKIITSPTSTATILKEALEIERQALLGRINQIEVKYYGE